ncbi:hypothetical protein EDD37DRAFT_679586 [Exophiala viscosa]|uniref:Peptidase M20 dimerisation domain-containing protein n=1 Tax=Exophiala viscosa TaxID=2486360 RepID=A0AAN6DW84_9EURO|nr:hypothetical protein EDD36DRAFT_452500 [Exophiala viscosa]KAI1626349.1 hypothetical protein EDD37DRAFT_679586 [Exophiala viscosa]
MIVSRGTARPLGLLSCTVDSVIAGLAFCRRSTPNTHRFARRAIGTRMNKERLWNAIHETAEWGATPDGGVRRLALTDKDKAVREWFMSTTKSLGCSVKVDEMGVIFATRPGTSSTLAPIGIGSHLDTQPAGGRYDGILGVLSGIEILRVLEENQVKTHAPITVIDWTSEEGARFNTGMVSSGVWSGRYTLDYAHAIPAVEEDETGKATLRSELERIGFLGKVPASYTANPLSAHFELHIEQGPVLEDEGKKVGVVTGVQSMGWLVVTVHGANQHSGTCPMDRRRCALTSAARMISRVEEIALSAEGLSTVGVINSWPQSPATVPHKVVFSVDLSHHSTEVRERMIADTRAEFGHIAHANKCTVEIEDIWNSPAVQFHEDCISSVREAARSVAGQENVKEMMAGAGHDSVHTADRCPTSMVFVPSKGGISHHPDEYSSPEQCALGAQVLLESVLRYDDQLKAKDTSR